MRNKMAAYFVGLCMAPYAAGAADRGAQGYQVSPGHNARVTFAKSWGPSLKLLWTATLDGTASYPLFVDGRVFVLVNGSPQEIATIDAKTGAVVSKLSAGTTSSQGIAYDEGALFSVDSSGVLNAYSVVHQKQIWSRQLPNQYSFSSAPSALNGIVYVGGAGEGGTLYATAEKTGKLLWAQSVENGDNSSPAVTPKGVYVSYPCQYYDFAPVTGSVIWHYTGDCEGGGGNTMVVANGLAFVRDPVGADVILDAATGASVGSFSASAPPAIATPNLAFFLDYGTLSAVAPTTAKLFWEFTGDGSLATPPLIVNGWVIAASGSGKLYVLNGATGAVAYSTTLSGAPGASLGAGGGMVLVPVGNTVVALGSAN